MYTVTVYPGSVTVYAVAVSGQATKEGRVNARIGPYLFVFAFAAGKPSSSLEVRMKEFLESEPATASLDTPEYAQIFGSSGKADYLLGNGRFVAELKTINGDPKDRVERRLKERFAKPGSPIVLGRTGLAPALERMEDRSELEKAIHDLSARSVRRHLQKATEQARATKEALGCPRAAGLAILMNDAEKMIDAANIGYSVKSAMEVVPGGYADLSYIWASVEAHRIRLPDGQLGYPQLVIAKSIENAPEMDFVARMLAAWAAFNQAELQQIQHGGSWDAMAAVYDDGPPVLELY